MNLKNLNERRKMASLNKIMIIGRLGQDPEVKNTNSGDSVGKFSVAVSEQWKDKQGQKQEKTEWINVQVWGKLAELAGQYLKKGSSVYVEGKLETSSWEDKETGQRKYKTEVKAHGIQFLDSKNDPEAGPKNNQRPPQQPEPTAYNGNDTVPF